MADWLNFEIAPSFRHADVLSGSFVADALDLSVESLVAACKNAAQPGLVALQTNVGGIRSRTGRLRRSPAIKAKVYRGRNGLNAMALVGYKSGIAPHSYYIEFGTKARGKRRAVAGMFPLERAFNASRQAMQGTMSAELQKIMAAAAARVKT